MFSFSEIVGHEQIKEHMQAAIRDKKPFHAYLFQGEEGVGKEALARTFAAGLQCQSESADKPCKECVSCRQMESGNQPDVIWVTREKASLGVDEIREQLCNTMDIKPFSSPYKIYLVPEAEKMTEAAQNALLKTIEEPPEYGIVILMTSNISADDSVALSYDGVSSAQHCRCGIVCQRTLSGAGLSGESECGICTGKSGESDAVCQIGRFH